jgi:hypothetical protein
MGQLPENPHAFPTFEDVEQYDEDRGKYVSHVVPTEGMTLRDYFAAKAMQAFISTSAAPAIVGGLDGAEPYCAAAAYLMADAMLRERSKS